MEGGLLVTGMRLLVRNRRTWRREGTVAAVVCAVAFAHFVTPAGLHGWHWIHILLDWGGYRMAQADQVGEIASFLVIALTSSLLFDRERRALAETAARNGVVLISP